MHVRSRYRRHDLFRGFLPVRQLLSATLLLSAFASAAVAQRARLDLPVVNGSVLASAVMGDTLLLGGSFDVAGPATGNGVLVDATSGALMGDPLLIEGGSVHAAISDGVGGFYIGGSFTTIRGLAHPYLARLLADGSVAAWKPNVPKPVFALALDGATLYAGGGDAGFESYLTPSGSFGEQTFIHSPGFVAGFSTAASGGPIWSVIPDAEVTALAVQSGTLYVGGRFLTVQGTARRRACAFDLATRTLTAWHPRLRYNYAISGSLFEFGDVRTMAFSNGLVYLGGKLNDVLGQARTYLAAVDPVSGAPATWAPFIQQDAIIGAVSSLAASDSLLYVGGEFYQVGSAIRQGIAAIGGTSLQPTAWDPGLLNEYGASQFLTIDGSTLYLAGGFSSVQGQTRTRLAAFDLATGAVSALDCPIGGKVAAFAKSGNTLFVGGDLRTAGTRRTSFLAMSRSGGQLIGWGPSVNGAVRSIVVNGPRIHVGGSFTQANGLERLGYLQLHRATGALQPAAVQIHGTVYAMALVGTKLVLGGSFIDINGTLVRNNLVCVLATNAAVTFDTPSADGTVLSLLLDGSRLFVGGEFTHLNTLLRQGIGAFDISTWQATPWDAGGSANVNAIQKSGNQILIGGRFIGAGPANTPRAALAAFDATTAALLPWNPGADQRVNRLIVSGNHVFVAGAFSTLGGQPAGRLGVVRLSDGTAESWQATADQEVTSLELVGNDLIVGGGFIHLGGDLRPGFALLPNLSTLDAPRPTPANAVSLAAPNPDPVRDRATLSFTLPQPGHVRLSLIDVQGRQTTEPLADGEFGSGTHTLSLSATGLRPGLYWLRLETLGERRSQRVVVMR